MGTEVQEERGWVPYSRHWDGADPLHICRIRVRSGPTCCSSGKDWSGCGRAVAVCAREAATEAEWRERVQGMGRGVTALRVPLGGELFSAKINFRENEIGH